MFLLVKVLESQSQQFKYFQIAMDNNPETNAKSLNNLFSYCFKTPATIICATLCRESRKK